MYNFKTIISTLFDRRSKSSLIQVRWAKLKQEASLRRVYVIAILLILVIASRGEPDSFHSIPGTASDFVTQTDDLINHFNFLGSENLLLATQSSNTLTDKRVQTGLSKMNGTVNGALLFDYVREPAPMGIVDYGLSSISNSDNFRPYSYSTTGYIGAVTINSLFTRGNESVGNSVSIQLNTVLVFNNSLRQYNYWIQNVAILNTSSRYIYFEDNIWNLSMPRSGIYGSTVEGNGRVAESTSFYYYYIASKSNSNGIYLTFPATINLELVSFENPSGYPTVSFMYNDGFGWKTYDTAIFEFAHRNSEVRFEVNGNQETPAGLDYDVELILGGPWDGFSTRDLSSNISLMLEYWNGNNFQTIGNAFDFGSDSSETISNVQISAGHFGRNGSVFLTVLAGNGSLNESYSLRNLSNLVVLSAFPTGKVRVGDQYYNFTEGKLDLTLYPGTYPLEFSTIQINHRTYWNTSVTLYAGKSTVLNIPVIPIGSLIIVIGATGLLIAGILVGIGSCKKRRLRH